MTDFEDRARSAGAALRQWMPDDDTPSPTATARRAVHRTRTHRLAAGTLALAVLGGVGLTLRPGPGGNDVEMPDDVAENPDTTTTTAPDRTTSTDSSGTTADPADTTTTSSTTTSTTAPPPVPTSCTGQVEGTDVTFEITLPAGWHGNEAALGEPACHHFGPEPIDLRPTETEAGVGVASNAVVKLYVSQGPGGLPETFDEAVAREAAGAEASRQITIDGHAAARFERLTGPGDDVPVGGERYVHWMVDLGDVFFDATTTIDDGLTYEETAAAVDQIVESIDFSR
jgi:hypothetical protein